MDMPPIGTQPPAGSLNQFSLRQNNSKTATDEKKESGPADSYDKATPKKAEDFQSYLDRPDVREMIMKLQARDSEVRAHESAHMAAGSGIAGDASFTYQKGPDGREYAIGGEVPIDMSTGSNPKETQAKMQKVRAAALAPATPSPQDIKIASTASMLEMRARLEEIKEQQTEVKEKEKEKSSVTRSDEADTGRQIDR